MPVKVKKEPEGVTPAVIEEVKPVPVVQRPAFVPRPNNFVPRPAYNAPQNMGEIETIAGYLDDSNDGHGVLRPHFSPSEKDTYVSSMVVRRLGLRPGDYVEGTARKPKENERYYALVTVTKVNGKAPSETHKRIKFHNLTPIYPIQRIS